MDVSSWLEWAFGVKSLSTDKEFNFALISTWPKNMQHPVE